VTRTIAELPGPRRLPLIGNAHQLIPPSRLHLTAERWADRYGPIVRVNLGTRRIVGISDQETINDETRPAKTLAFGAGPRFCPGRNLALLESKAALSMISRSFEWELDESAGPVREAFEFAIVPRGLRVLVRGRGKVAV
jgi:cytochrome P450